MWVWVGFITFYPVLKSSPGETLKTMRRNNLVSISCPSLIHCSKFLFFCQLNGTQQGNRLTLNDAVLRAGVSWADLHKRALVQDQV